MRKIVHILKKEDKRLLHSFLKANNALTQFKRNCRYRGTMLHLHKYHINNIITCAFYWMEQPEGDEYWRNLHCKWKRFLEHRKNT